MKLKLPFLDQFFLLLLWAEHGSSDVAAGELDVGSLLDLVHEIHGWPIGTRALQSSDEFHVH